jgi:uncharacterized protein RhaS with RHS repeats
MIVGRDCTTTPFRFYDPVIERLTTSDPIGLLGGLNLISTRRIRLGGWIRGLGLLLSHTDHY